MAAHFFCPGCWKEIDQADLRCPHCGYLLEAFQGLSYEEKLIRAVGHPVRENRMMAIRILGSLQSRAAVAALGSLLDREGDYYVIREAVVALRKIGGTRKPSAGSNASDITRPGWSERFWGRPPEARETGGGPGGETMIGRRERNKLYLDLWDAFHREGCPVCTCVDAGTIGQVRAALEQASGKQPPRLCIAHTARMAAGDDDRGCAAVVRFIRNAEDWIKEQISRERKPPGVRALVKRFREAGGDNPFGSPSPDCMACRVQRGREKKILTLLPEALTDPDFDRSFRESNGLCFRHLFLLHGLYPGKPAVAAVLKAQLRKLEDLRVAIAPHRFQPERTGPPADPAAWERVKLLLRCSAVDPGEEGGEPLAGADSATGCPAEETRAAEADVGVDPAVDADGFEKEKWRRSRAMLQKQLEKESSRAAALHYRYWKAMEDNKTLQMNLAGAQALVRSLEERIAGLQDEILSLKPPGDAAEPGRRRPLP